MFSVLASAILSSSWEVLATPLLWGQPSHTLLMHLYDYAGFGLHWAYAAHVVTVAETTVTEVEVPQYVYKAVNEKMELAHLCHNGLGFAIP